MIAVVDYKAGNLTSVMKALAAVGANAFSTDDPDTIRRADKIVLPGVGHFSATEFLNSHGLTTVIADRTRAGIPFLGICVGLQWLFAGSSEAPECSGLGAFNAVCERFAKGKKIPHVGWNSLDLNGNSRLMAGVPSGSFVYFTHSYRAPIISATVAVTHYDAEPFTAAVEHGNVMGVQFHPEKSGSVGLQILRNFLEWQLC